MVRQKRFKIIKGEAAEAREVFCTRCGSLTTGPGFLCALCEYNLAAKGKRFKPSIKVVRR